MIPVTVWEFAQESSKRKGVTRVSVLMLTRRVEVEATGVATNGTAEQVACHASESTGFDEIDAVGGTTIGLLVDTKMANLRRMIKKLAFRRFGSLAEIQF